MTLIAPLFLLFVSSSPGIEALKPTAEAFHRLGTLAQATRLEHDLRDWIVLEPRGAAALRHAGILRTHDSLDVFHPSGFPQALLVRVRLQMPAGVDSAAWLFESRQGKWVRTLSLEREGQKTASRLADLTFGPPDKSGTRLAIAVRTPAGVSGCWHPVAFQVYRVGTPTPPPLLMDDWHGANLCKRAPGVKAGVDSFSITLEDRDLPAGSTRTHILQYQISAERPARIQPVALQPREFVDEWLERPWKEAIDWTAPAVRASLEKVHQELGGVIYGAYRSAAPCGEARWEVAVDLEKHGARYFLVRQVAKEEFQLLGVSAAASNCGVH